MDLFSPVTRNANKLTANMRGRAPTRGDPDAFLSSLVEFCADSVSTCFSRDANKLCVPIGLSSLSTLFLLLSCFLWVLFFFFFCFLLPAFVPAIHCKSLYSIQSALTVFRLVYQRCRCRRENPGEILTFLYSLVGNLCGAVGATLARQLHIQVNGCNRGASLLSVVAHFCSLSSVGFSERCFCCPGCCPFYFLVLPCAPVLELKGG